MLPRENPSSSRVWQIVPSNRPVQYASSVKTHIQQILPASGLQQEDSSLIQSQYSIQLDRKTDITSIEGSITTFSIQSGQRIGSDSPLSTFPVPFKGQLSSHEMHLESLSPALSGSASPITCGASFQAAVSSVQRNIFIIPLEIHIGDTWQDSISSVVCSGPIPVNLIDKRDYKLVAEAEYRGMKVFMITRNEKALFYGEGSQDQHRVTVRGETLGTAQLYADPITGTLLNITTENKTTLSIEASGRVQQFLQSSREITSQAN